MGNGCCSAFCSSENEIAIDLGFLQEMDQNVTHLEELLSIIDNRLEAIAATNDNARQNTSSQQVGSSSKFGSCVNSGKDLVMNMSKRAERNRCMACFKSAYNRETRKMVFDVLKGASQIQFLAAGVCVIGYLLDQIEQVSSNRDQCIQLLRCLCALARRVKQLDNRVPAEIESLDKAVIFIFDGCVMCLTQMESHRLFRIFQASADAADLQKLESEIRNTYADLILGVVIQNIPYYPRPTQGHDPKPVGREVQKERVIKLLKVDPTDDSKIAVVIYGFGGIGKTTLASAVFNNLDLKHYKFCRLDMDQNVSHDGIKQLQQRMLRQLFEKGNVLLDSYGEGQSQLTEAFTEHSGDRIFLFIDNALEASNLAKLLPTDLSCLPRGIRILITTRKLDQTDMLSRTDFERIPFEVGVLSLSDSKKLLIKIALGSASASLPQGIESIDVEDVVNMCGGIPLLVELVAPKFKKYLSRASEFKSLKEFLEEFVTAGTDIERVVDEVFKSLDELSKEAFLDIVCFLDKESVVNVSVVVGKVQLEVLLDAALVKLSFLDDEDNDTERLWSIMFGSDQEEWPQFILEGRTVRVHDIIKARGGWLSKQDRILEVESLKDALQDTQRLQKMKGITISDLEESDEFEIKAESLNIMHSSLRVLILPTSIKVDGICHRSFDSLKYLSVDGNLPIHPKQLRRLAVLTGANSENIDKLPPSLHYLSLKNSANLPSLLQSFDNLSSLQYLDLSDCDALTKVPTSIGKLESLTCLDLIRCGNLTTLPENIQNLSALQCLDLSGCTKLANLPPTFGQLKSLVYLDMSNCSEFTFLPDILGNLSTLLMLILNKCEKLVELPKSFGALFALKFLDLSDCANLESLPESFGQLKSLRCLSICRCLKLKMLNGGFESLTSLMLLDARDCESLNEEAMDILVQIESLMFLNIDESPSLIQRWEQIGHRYPLIVATKDNDEFLHTIEHMLFHGGGRFVGVENDGGQLVDWSWSCFAGEEEEVEVSVLLTMCDLSLDCNKNALQIVRKEIERRMEESRSGGRKFQIVYAEAGDSMDKSEERICQTLSKLIPSCTCACMPTDNKTSRLFAYALYKLLQYQSRYVIQSLHTCIFGLRVQMQRDKKWAEFQSECFPNDHEEALMDEGGGFDKLFSTLDVCSNFLEG